jgi:hypothetical protein
MRKLYLLVTVACLIGYVSALVCQPGLYPSPDPNSQICIPCPSGTTSTNALSIQDCHCISGISTSSYTFGDETDIPLDQNTVVDFQTYKNFTTITEIDSNDNTNLIVKIYQQLNFAAPVAVLNTQIFDTTNTINAIYDGTRLLVTGVDATNPNSFIVGGWLSRPNNSGPLIPFVLSNVQYTGHSYVVKFGDIDGDGATDAVLFTSSQSLSDITITSFKAGGLFLTPNSNSIPVPDSLVVSIIYDVTIMTSISPVTFGIFASLCDPTLPLSGCSTQFISFSNDGVSTFYPILSTPINIVQAITFSDSVTHIVAIDDSLNVYTWVYATNSLSSFKKHTLTQFASVNSLATSDIDSDGRGDIVVEGSTVTGSVELAVFFGTNNNNFVLQNMILGSLTIVGTQFLQLSSSQASLTAGVITTDSLSNNYISLFSRLSTSQCVICSVDRLPNCQCPGGTQAINSSDVTSGCTPCSPGTASTAGSTCTPCNPGTFASTSGQSVCISCPPGKYAPFPGVTSCATVSQGYSVSDVSIVACNNGQYQPTAGQSTCLICGNNTYSSGVFNHTNTFTANGRTSFSSLTGGDTVCTSCPTNAISPSGSGSVAACQCPVGYQLSAGECTMCSVGTYKSSPGSGQCITCPVGQFQDVPGQSVCKPCPAGQFQDATGQPVCKACAPGTVSQDGAGICIACLIGQFQPLSGQSTCLDCDVGSASDGVGVTSCVGCNIGTFQNVTGQATCVDCPAHATTTNVNSTSINMCSCVNNYIRVNGTGDDFTCQQCPLNSQRIDTTASCQCLPGYGRINSSDFSQGCTQCLGGAYADVVSQLCVGCPAGTASSGIGVTGVGSCVACLPGSAVSTTGATQCTLCEAETAQSQSGQLTCPPCPLGSTSAVGATKCTACQPGQYHTNGGCMSCPFNAYQPTSGSTACIPCPGINTNTSHVGSIVITDCQCQANYVPGQVRNVYTVAGPGIQPGGQQTYGTTTGTFSGQYEIGDYSTPLLTGQAIQQIAVDIRFINSVTSATLQIVIATFNPSTTEITPIFGTDSGPYPVVAGTNIVQLLTPIVVPVATSNLYMIFYLSTPDSFITYRPDSSGMYLRYLGPSTGPSSVDDRFQPTSGLLQFNVYYGVVAGPGIQSGGLPTTGTTTGSFGGQYEIADYSTPLQPGTIGRLNIDIGFVNDTQVPANLQIVLVTFIQDPNDPSGNQLDAQAIFGGNVVSPRYPVVAGINVIEFSTPLIVVAQPNSIYAVFNIDTLSAYVTYRPDSQGKYLQYVSPIVNSALDKFSVIPSRVLQFKFYYATADGLTHLACLPCPSNSYRSNLTSLTCTCVDGFEFRDGQCLPCFRGDAGVNGVCTECEPGTFSPPSGGATACTQCDSTSFNPLPGQIKCLPCPPNQFSAVNGTACSPCQLGSYSTGTSGCTPCPPGSIVNGIATGCDVCTPGTFAATPGSTVCTTCPGGSFSHLNASMCTLCGVGSYSVDGASDCTSCEAGKFSVGNVTVCTTCPNGSVSSPEAESCTGCDNSHYASTNKSICIGCSVGSTSTLTNGTRCVCDPGFGCDSCVDSGLYCFQCAPGTYSTGNDTDQSCKPCSPGQFSGNVGAIACTPCDVNSTSLTGSSECLCVDNLYRNFGGNCVPCPTNSGRLGTDTSNICVCNTNYKAIVSPDGDFVCSLCPDGSVLTGDGCQACGLGSVAVSGDVTCTQCKSSEYVVNNSTCGLCGINAVQDVTNVSQCICNDGYGLNGTCVACQAGSHSTRGMCVDCDYGFYSSSPQLTACISCGDNSNTTSTGSTSLANCMCKSGFYRDYSQVATGQCISCPTGSNRNFTDISNFCTCNPGLGQLINDIRSPCDACEPGTYLYGGLCVPCPSTQILTGNDAASCQDCSAGTYRFNATYCSSCLGGTFSLSGATECSSCPAGKFSVDGATECSLCSIGTYNQQTGQSVCVACNDTSVASTGATVCTQCDLPFVPNADKSACISCGDGYYPSPDGCTPCAPGSFSVAGDVLCTLCDAGSYQPASGQSYDNLTLGNGCLPCPDGFISTTNGATICTICQAGSYGISGESTCELCSAGTYQDQIGSAFTGDNGCPTCEAGTYSIEGSTTCTLCSSGSFSDPNSGECILCDLGQYAPTNGSSTCNTCPAGSFSNTTGASNCTLCNVDMYQSIPGDTECLACLPGTCTNGRIGSVSCDFVINVCNGCSEPLSGILGDSCGSCGTLQCNPDRNNLTLVCMGNHSTNECGGCGSLNINATVGSPCDTGNSDYCGKYVCDTSDLHHNTLICPIDPNSESRCGSCDSNIVKAFGQPCGCGNLGTFECPISNGNLTCTHPGPVPCVSGHYYTDTTKCTCTACPPGSYQPSDSNIPIESCILCPPGTYQNMRAQPDCRVCPVRRGKTASSPLGSTSRNQCTYQ